MSTIQRIRYTLTGYNFTEISSRKGSIEYQLMDDQGNERTVTALATLNLFKKIKSVRPVYHRETPLVHALAKTQLNESLLVDFTEFNQQNPRTGSLRKQNLTTKSIKVKNNGSSSIVDFQSLLDNKSRFAQLAFFTISGFVAVTFLLSKIPSPYS